MSSTAPLLASVVAALVLSAGGCAAPKGDAAPVAARSEEWLPADPLDGLRADWQARAAGYLDRRSASWLASPPPVANVACAMSCHTTFPYVLARAALAPHARTPAADEARVRFEARVAAAAAGAAIPFYGKDDDEKARQSHATEAVLNAAALALDDVGSGRQLGASTTRALDRMWSQQRADGAWDWLDFGLEPWEARADTGAAMAALVAGSIPAGSTGGQAAGTTRLVAYLQQRLDGMALHDQAMVLWASGKLPGLLDRTAANQIAKYLRATQDQYGGFSLGRWLSSGLTRERAREPDGYATALAVLALCSGTAQGRKQRPVWWGLRWLAHHQAEDGSWPDRSMNTHAARADGFMTDAATAYAALAITRCR